MDARELNHFAAAYAPILRDARVARVVCVANGLLFDLQTAAGRRELALLGVVGAARAFCLDEARRERMHQDVAQLAPQLVTPLAEIPARWPANASVLDALRAWLLRPAAQPPEWLQLEGARVRDVRAQAHDRRLWLDLEKHDALQRVEPLILVAELFDRGANFILQSASGEERANWRGRRPAPDRLAAIGSQPEDASEATHTGPDAPRGDAPSGAPMAAPGDPGASAPWNSAPSLVRLAPAAAHELLSVHRRGQRRHERRARAKVTKLEADARRAEQAHTLRRMAEALTANLHRVRRGQARVSLDDLYAPGNVLEIELDPRLSPQENAAALFKRARRGDRGQETITSRLEEARRDLAAVAASPQLDAESPDWPTALRLASATWSASLTDALSRADASTLWSPGGPRWERPSASEDSARRAERDPHPGRLFRLPGNWEVRVGRNNAENDVLTHQFAHPDDVWLHASGVPGSHVVLRMKGLRDNPPREVLEAAAAIAARFSRAKHARTVPVIWTRKRHVRKPRKSKPGLAVCTHEKTVFVHPGLPAGEDDVETGTEMS